MSWWKDWLPPPYPAPEISEEQRERESKAHEQRQTKWTHSDTRQVGALASLATAISTGNPIKAVKALSTLMEEKPTSFPKRTLGKRMAYGKRKFKRTAYRRRPVYRRARTSYRKKPMYKRRKNPTLSLIWKALHNKV